MTAATDERVDVALADAMATITAALDRMGGPGRQRGDTALLNAVVAGASNPTLALAATATLAAYLADALATATGTTAEAVVQRIALRIASGDSPKGPLDLSRRR